MRPSSLSCLTVEDGSPQEAGQTRTSVLVALPNDASARAKAFCASPSNSRRHAVDCSRLCLREREPLVSAASVIQCRGSCGRSPARFIGRCSHSVRERDARQRRNTADELGLGFSSEQGILAPLAKRGARLASCSANTTAGSRHSSTRWRRPAPEERASRVRRLDVASNAVCRGKGATARS